MKQRYLYDSYGSQTVLSPTWGSITDAYGMLVGFQGKRFDPATGLYLFNIGGEGRDYRPTLGRWVQQDRAGYVDGTNLYGFVRNNPIDNVDPNGLCVSDFTGGDPSGSTGGFESTWEATKNLYNWWNWKWGSSDDRIRMGANDYYSRLIRQEPQFGKDRQDFLNGLKSKVNEWAQSNRCDNGEASIGHSATYTEAIYSPEKSAWNPHNWFIGQLTLGRFNLKMQAIATIKIKSDGKGHVTGNVSVRIDYSVNDQFDPLGKHDPKQFTNVIQWTENGITATIDSLKCNKSGNGDE